MDASSCASPPHRWRRASSCRAQVSAFRPSSCCSSRADCCCCSWNRPGERTTMHRICHRPDIRLIDDLIGRLSSPWTRQRQLGCRTYAGACLGSCGSAYAASCCPVKSTAEKRPQLNYYYCCCFRFNAPVDTNTINKIVILSLSIFVQRKGNGNETKNCVLEE